MIRRGRGGRGTGGDSAGVAEARIGGWVGDVEFLPDEVQTVQRMRTGCDDRIACGGWSGVYRVGELDRGEVVADLGYDIGGDGDFPV